MYTYCSEYVKAALCIKLAIHYHGNTLGCVPFPINS